jgi:hypothetical protein
MQPINVYIAYSTDLRLDRQQMAFGDEPDNMAKLAQSIELGNNIWKEWAISSGGKWLGTVGDVSYLEIGADHLGDLPGLVDRYGTDTKGKVSVGLGKKLSEADQSLQACLKTSPGTIRLFDDTVTKDLSEDQEEWVAKSEFVLVKAMESNAKFDPANGGGFQAPQQPLQPDSTPAQPVEPQAPQFAQQEPPQDLMGQFQALAEQSQGEEQAKDEAAQGSQSAQDLREQIASTLEDFRGQAETLETLQQSDPELYKTLVEVVQNMIAMARELYGNQPVQKSEDLEKALPKTAAENKANQAAFETYSHPVGQDQLLEQHGGQVFNPTDKVNLVQDPVDASDVGTSIKMRNASYNNNRNTNRDNEEYGDRGGHHYADAESQPNQFWQSADAKAHNLAHPIPDFHEPVSGDYAFHWRAPEDQTRPYLVAERHTGPIDENFPIRFAHPPLGGPMRPQDYHGRWLQPEDAAELGWDWNSQIVPISQHIAQHYKRLPDLDDPQAALKSEALTKAKRATQFAPQHVVEHLRDTDNSGDPDWLNELINKVNQHSKWNLASIPVSSIDSGDQRNSDVISEYADMSGDTAPPIVVDYDTDGQLYTLDGGHRVQAAQVRGDTHIGAYVPHVTGMALKSETALAFEALAKSYVGPKYDTVESFMGGIKQQPTPAAKGLYITAHLGHAPFLQALKTRPQGPTISKQLWTFVNGRANATVAGAGVKATAKTELQKDAMLPSPYIAKLQHAKKPGKTGHFAINMPPGSQVDTGPTGSNIPGRKGGRKKVVDPATNKTKWREMRAGQVMAPDGSPTSSRHPFPGGDKQQ